MRTSASFVVRVLIINLVTICLAEPVLAVRQWYTDESRYLVQTAAWDASVDKNAYCDPRTRDTEVVVHLRFHSEVGIEVGNNPVYLGIVKSEIAPAVRSICGEVARLVVLNYFSQPLKNTEGAEIPASRATFRNLLVPDCPVRIEWVWFDAIFAGEFPGANTDSFGDNLLTTERAIRSWLSRGAPDQLIAEFKKSITKNRTRSVEASSAPQRQKAELSNQSPGSQKLSTQVGANSLVPQRLEGFANRRSIEALFLGDFDNVGIKRDDLLFAALLQQYLNAYARTCDAYLPATKVEMTEPRCRAWREIRNGLDVLISKTCLEYEALGTGLYADPELYAAKKEIDRVMNATPLRQVGDLLKGNMISVTQDVVSDMNALVQMNDCLSPSLKRFEENLRRFALNQSPIITLLDKCADPQPATTNPELTLDEQDYAELVEELVADQSKSWAVNRFRRLQDTLISSRDTAGFPSRIVAFYEYDGFGGRSFGSVSLHLSKGLPKCMYFFDTPDVCKAPNQEIIASFSAGLGKGRREEAEASTTLPPTTVSTRETASDKSVAAAVDLPAPPVPRRRLKAVSYIQGIKDACLEILANGDRREPEASYCSCLSAAAGSIPISDADAQWFFENFSDEARGELEQRYPGLVRRFASCRAQLEAASSAD